jgi:hypothetical protein
MHGMSAFPPPEAAPSPFAPQSGTVAPQTGLPEPREGVSAAVGDGTDEARLEAYKESILANFGGKRGLTEAGLPSVVFIVVYTATRSLNTSLWSAVAVAAVLTVVRLAQRDKLQHAMSGLFGVVVCAAFAKYTGQAKNFYLPGVLMQIGEGILFSVSALVRWPLVGVIIGPITGEMMAWREHPERLRVFTIATWLLVGMFALRVAIEVPLYLANQLTALGAAKVVLGYPLYIAVLFVCWRVIKKAPLPAQAS